MKKIFLASAVSSAVLLTLVGCGSSSSPSDIANGAIGNATVAVSGTVTDATSSAALSGVKVEGIYPSGFPESNTTTDGSGNYSISPFKSTDFYLRASDDGTHVTMNSSIRNLAADDTGNDISMPTPTEANGLISMAFPSSTGKTIAGSAWLVVDVVDASGGQFTGQSISTTPATAIDTAQGFSTVDGPTYIAQYNAQGKVDVTVNGKKQSGFLVNGEVLYMEFQQ